MATITATAAIKAANTTTSSSASFSKDPAASKSPSGPETRRFAHEYLPTHNVDEDDKERADKGEAYANQRSRWPNGLGFDTVRYEHEPISLPVSGHIPAYAAGVIYRNGPGARQVNDEKSGESVFELSHWFDAFAMLHRFELVASGDGRGCEVTYRSRSHTDELMKSARQTKRLAGYTFAQKRDPCMSLFWKVAAMFERTPTPAPQWNNVSITVSANPVGIPAPLTTTDRDNTAPVPPPLRHSSGQQRQSTTPYLIARTDEGTLKALDPDTLEPVGIAHQKELHPLLKGPLSASHAKSDPLTGDVFNYNLDLGYRAVYRVFRTSASTGETEILAEIAHADIPPAYMHSFFLTEDYVVLCVWGAHLAGSGISVLWERNILDALQPLDTDKKAFWFVVDRKTGKGVVKAFQSRNFFCFHTINAWQDGSDIVCDLIEYDSLDVLHGFYYENIRPQGHGGKTLSEAARQRFNPHYARYRLPGGASLTKENESFETIFAAKTEAVREQTLDPAEAGDVPTINTNYLTKPSRYFYCCPNRGLATFVDSLCKVDTVTRTSTFWENEWGHSPSEAIFVADPNGTEEDDGVLLTVVLDGVNETSYLLCLDAKTMTELGRADCQGPLLFSFHGQHVKSGPSYTRPIDI